MKEEPEFMTSKRVGNVIISLLLLILLTGTVSADVVQAGSSFDATLASITTHLDMGMVSDDPGSPVVLDYEVSAQGITSPDGSTTPMIGSAEAYIKAHTYGDRYNSGMNTGELTYSDTTRASGLISSFRKSVTYRGGSVLY